MVLWLKKQDTFVCPYRYDATWTVNGENLARCFLRVSKDLIHSLLFTFFRPRHHQSSPVVYSAFVYLYIEHRQM